MRRADDRPQKMKNSSKMAAVAKLIDDITDPTSSKSLHLPKIAQGGRREESAKSSLDVKVRVDCLRFVDGEYVCVFATTFGTFLQIYISLVYVSVHSYLQWFTLQSSGNIIPATE